MSSGSLSVLMSATELTEMMLEAREEITRPTRMSMNPGMNRRRFTVSGLVMKYSKFQPPVIRYAKSRARTLVIL